MLETLCRKENQDILLSSIIHSSDIVTLSSLLNILIVMTRQCVFLSCPLCLGPSFVNSLVSSTVFNSLIHILSISNSNILVSQVIEFTKLLVLNRISLTDYLIFSSVQYIP